MPPLPHQKKPTIKDVAAKAGVSSATVSFVLNNRPGQAISDKVRKRVLRIAEQLNYHPSATAAGLARKRTHNMGVVFYRDEQLISNAFYSFVVQGVIKEAIRREYNLLFSFLPVEYRGYADLPKIVRENNVEGVILVRETSPRLVKDIEARGIPVVAIDNFPPLKGVQSIEIDNRHGGRIAADHLVALGHRRIAFLQAAMDRPSIAERGQGFRAGLEAAGLRFSPRTHLVRAAELTFDGGRDAAERMFASPHRPSAVFCANDEVAAGVLRAALLRGLAVPRDLSVVGFDDITMSNYTYPPLTTVGVDKEALGVEAMSWLIELVERGRRDPSTRLAAVSLVERQTTARPSG
ncbi:MAG: LacI family DNA-binding transcriptional regulator [Polyangiaceae bacterium]|nr:LacI family DNA-binding transcriptional regulator [Polyangiaceae bacterium]